MNAHFGRLFLITAETVNAAEKETLTALSRGLRDTEMKIRTLEMIDQAVQSNSQKIINGLVYPDVDLLCYTNTLLYQTKRNFMEDFDLLGKQVIGVRTAVHEAESP